MAALPAFSGRAPFPRSAPPLPVAHVDALGALLRAALPSLVGDAVAVVRNGEAGPSVVHAEFSRDAARSGCGRGWTPWDPLGRSEGGSAAADGHVPNVLSVPLRAGGALWGSFQVHRRSARPWTEADLAVAGLFAETAVSLALLVAERDGWRTAWREAEHAATHDPLTGLPNRAVLFDRLEHAIANGARHGRGVGVLFVDVDGFKAVNDRFGHAAGDATLVEVARRLGSTLRANDTLARLSGDEFVAVCEDLDVSSGHVRAWLRQLSRRILEELRRPAEPGRPEIDVSVSIGAAVSTHRCSGRSLVGWADEAMYAAKQAGGGRVVIGRDRPAPSAPGRRTAT